MSEQRIVQTTFTVCRADIVEFEGVLYKDIIYYLWYCLYDTKMNMESTKNYFKAVVNPKLKVSIAVRNNEQLILVSTETGKQFLVYPLVDIPILKNQLWGRGLHVPTH